MLPYLKCLRKLQQILGELNDLSVQRSLAAELAHDSRLQQSVSDLRARLKVRERVLCEEAARAWSEIESKKPFRKGATAVRAMG
jgi:CHAD domain-containing protein